MTAVKVTGLTQTLSRLYGMESRAKDCTGFTRTLAQAMAREINTHFKAESGPGGKWKPCSAEYAERRAKGRGGNKILQDTGVLRGSMVNRWTTRVAQVSTQVPYAATHQYGDESRNVPARPFMWLPEKFMDTWTTKFQYWLVG